MHTVLFVAESFINGNLCSERISRQQQGICKSRIDLCERAWSDNCECRVLGQTALLSIQDNYHELNHKP